MSEHYTYREEIRDSRDEYFELGLGEHPIDAPVDQGNDVILAFYHEERDDETRYPDDPRKNSWLAVHHTRTVALPYLLELQEHEKGAHPEWELEHEDSPEDDGWFVRDDVAERAARYAERNPGDWAEDMKSHLWNCGRAMIVAEQDVLRGILEDDETRIEQGRELLSQAALLCHRVEKTDDHFDRMNEYRSAAQDKDDPGEKTRLYLQSIEHAREFYRSGDARIDLGRIQAVTHDMVNEESLRNYGRYGQALRGKDDQENGLHELFRVASELCEAGPEWNGGREYSFLAEAARSLESGDEERAIQAFSQEMELHRTLRVLAENHPTETTEQLWDECLEQGISHEQVIRDAAAVEQRLAGDELEYRARFEPAARLERFILEQARTFYKIHLDNWNQSRHYRERTDRRIRLREAKTFEYLADPERIEQANRMARLELQP